MAAPLPLDILKAIDWTRSVIGGSYALCAFMGADWQPHDVDVMCQVASHADFDALVAQFRERALPLSSEVVKHVRMDDATRAAAARDTTSGLDERFHESILGTVTLRFDGLPVPVQLVGMCVRPPMTLLEHLNETTDLPACVAYTQWPGGPRIFHVPERGLEALRTRTVHRADSCAARMDKYKKRGFTFI